MNVTELAQKVREMRRAQQDFFRYRSGDNLDKAKAAEMEVDRIVGEILDPQGKLFAEKDS